GFHSQAWPAIHEYAILAADGRELNLQWYHTSMLDASGRITGTASLGVDLSQQRLLERQVEQAQRMETLGRMAGTVAHDFNNHLTVIKGYAELLSRRFTPGDAAGVQIRYIRESADLATTLVNKLLAFGRRQKIAPQIVSVNATIAGSQEIWRRLIREEIS